MLGRLPTINATKKIQWDYQDFLPTYTDSKRYRELVQAQEPDSLQQCTRDSFYLSLHQFDSSTQKALDRFKLCAERGIYQPLDDVDSAIHAYSKLISSELELGELGDMNKIKRVISFLTLGRYDDDILTSGYMQVINTDEREKLYQAMEMTTLPFFFESQVALNLIPDSICVRLVCTMLRNPKNPEHYKDLSSFTRRYISEKVVVLDDVQIRNVVIRHLDPQTKVCLFLSILTEVQFYVDTMGLATDEPRLPEWLGRELQNVVETKSQFFFAPSASTPYLTIYELLTRFRVNDAVNDALTKYNQIIQKYHHGGHGNKISKKRKQTIRKRKSNKHRMRKRMQGKKSRHL
jgi:hypothetical protein